jgi:peptide/nickel transport system ATP-binding protein/oligopeptide transport system ATP-binding protein
MENHLLSVQELKVYFHSEDKVSRAVDGISFNIEEGETVCLVGESGCGKTVSALAILGLISSPPGKIQGGKIFFRGKNLLEFDLESIRKLRGKNISMIFQEPLTSLNPVFSIGDQIEEAITVHQNDRGNETRKRTIDLLKDVGIPSAEKRLKEYPHQLSGGQRQRIMIAMALACNPDLVIADEPTTALDVTVQAQILELFRSLKEKHLMSTLYITHDLAVVKLIADRVYVMYAGLFVEQGSTEQIFSNPMHPYTRGLLGSLPYRTKRGKKLENIPGAVPDPAYKPDGCPFNPRCSYSVESCTQEEPDLCDYGAGHLARCPILYGEKYVK